MKLRAMVGLVAVAALAGSACSTTESGATLTSVNPVNRERSVSASDIDGPPTLVVASVDAAEGAEVELEGRARLIIPPGALSDDAEVRLTSEGDAPSTIAYPLEQAVAEPVSVEIRKAELTRPATLQLLYNKDQVELPPAPVVAGSSHWVDEDWVQLDAALDIRRGYVSVKSKRPNGWWRPSVWDMDRLPAVVDSLFVGLDAEVPKPECAQRTPAWVANVTASQQGTDPAHVCTEGIEGALSVRMVNRRPYSLAVESSRPPAWGWTNTVDQIQNELIPIVRAAQPGFSPQLFLPRFTEGALGVDGGKFEGGQVVAKPTATTMSIDVTVLVLEALGVTSSLLDWEPLIACAIPPKDGPVNPKAVRGMLNHLSSCAENFEGSDQLPRGYRQALTTVLANLENDPAFIRKTKEMMTDEDTAVGVLYTTAAAVVEDLPEDPEPDTTVPSRERDSGVLPAPPRSFKPSTPPPAPDNPLPRPVPIPTVPTTKPPPPPTTKPPPPPPTTKPPTTKPPTTKPPTTLPPTTAPPPTTSPPTTSPPTTSPPTTSPPTTSPPTTAPPTTAPPTTAPPTTAPPTTAPPPTTAAPPPSAPPP